jgi:hypothetical protein
MLWCRLLRPHEHTPGSSFSLSLRCRSAEWQSVNDVWGCTLIGLTFFHHRLFATGCLSLSLSIFLFLLLLPSLLADTSRSLLCIDHKQGQQKGGSFWIPCMDRVCLLLADFMCARHSAPEKRDDVV